MQPSGVIGVLGSTAIFGDFDFGPGIGGGGGSGNLFVELLGFW